MGGQNDNGHHQCVALGDLAAMYPHLRSLRISLQHEVRWCDIPYDPLLETRHNVVAQEAHCMLANIIDALRAYQSPRLKIREIRFQQRPLAEHECSPSRPAFRIDGTGRDCEDVAWEIMDYPHTIAKV